MKDVVNMLNFIAMQAKTYITLDYAGVASLTPWFFMSTPAFSTSEYCQSTIFKDERGSAIKQKPGHLTNGL